MMRLSIALLLAAFAAGCATPPNGRTGAADDPGAVHGDPAYPRTGVHIGIGVGRWGGRSGGGVGVGVGF